MILKLTDAQKQALDFGTRDQIDLNIRMMQAANLGATTPGWADLDEAEQQFWLRLLIQGRFDDQIYD